MTSRPRGRPHPPLLLAAAVLGIEVLVSAAFAVLQLLAQGSDAVVTAVAILLYATALAFVAVGVARGRRWSRAPAIATQLIQLPVAWGVRGAAAGVAGGLGLACLVVVVCLLLPSSTAVFVPDAERSAPRD